MRYDPHLNVAAIAQARRNRANPLPTGTYYHLKPVYENIGIYADYDKIAIAQIIFDDSKNVYILDVRFSQPSINSLIAELENLKEIPLIAWRKYYINKSPYLEYELKQRGTTPEVVEINEGEEIYKLKSLLIDDKAKPIKEFASTLKKELDKYDEENSNHFIKALLISLHTLRGNYLV